jgi:hypothetical protein
MIKSETVLWRSSLLWEHPIQSFHVLDTGYIFRLGLQLTVPSGQDYLASGAYSVQRFLLEEIHTPLSVTRHLTVIQFTLLGLLFEIKTRVGQPATILNRPTTVSQPLSRHGEYMTPPPP